MEDIQQFLSDRVLMRYNLVTHQTEVHWLTDFGDDLQQIPQWERINDRIENTLWKELSKEKPVRMRDLQYVIGSDYVPAYHPFRFYLEHLLPWTEEQGDNIMELSLSVNVKGDSDEQFLFAEYLKKWLVAMVASWMDDRVVNNVMLVLIGPQGAYKTTWFAHLLPPQLREYFYTKTNSGMVSKDDLLTLSQYGLMCWEELDSMQLKELNKLKAVMTMPSINERAAYAHYHENRPHLASFCGTGNNVQFLSDPTGTRRWLPFEVENIDSPMTSPFNYEGIYSQAYALIDEYFRQPVGIEGGEYLPASVILQLVGGTNMKDINATKLGRALTAMGFESKMTRGIRRYRVVRRSTSEMQQHRQLQNVDLESGGVVE